MAAYSTSLGISELDPLDSDQILDWANDLFETYNADAELGRRNEKISMNEIFKDLMTFSDAGHIVMMGGDTVRLDHNISSLSLIGGDAKAGAGYVEVFGDSHATTPGQVEARIKGTGSFKVTTAAFGSTTPTTLVAVNSSGTVAITQGTITAAAPAIDASSTWNNAGVTFTGIKYNVTNTASAAASMLFDVQFNSTTMFNLREDGRLTLAGRASFLTTSSLGHIFNVSDTNTTSAVVAGNVGHTLSSGTAANGIGVIFDFNIDSTTTALTRASRWSTVWTDATHATRTSTVTFNTFVSGTETPHMVVGSGQVGGPPGTVSVPSWVNRNDTTTGSWYPASSKMAWSLGGSEKMRLDTTGLGLGTDTPQSGLHVTSSNSMSSTFLTTLETAIFAGGSTGKGFITLAYASADAAGGAMRGVKSRGTLATPTACVADDRTFVFLAAGHDGTSSINTALIDFNVDGAVSTGTVPQRITFTTGTTVANRTGRIKIASSDLVGIGTAIAGNPAVSPASLLHVASNTSASGTVIIEQGSADADPCRLNFRKSRGTVASPSVITAGDCLGLISFYAYSGAGGYVQSASIRADSTATVATTRVPATLTFSTGTDAAPTVLTDRMTIDKQHRVGIGPTVTPCSNLCVNNSTTATVSNFYETTDGLATPVDYRRLTITTQAGNTLLRTEAAGTGLVSGQPRILQVGTGPSTGTNIAGQDTIIHSGQPTGNAAPGAILFQQGLPAGGSGSGVTALATSWQIGSAGNLIGGSATNSFSAIVRQSVNGFDLQSGALTATWNDASTAASGTVANRYLFGLGAPTLSSTNATVTYTVASSIYIGGAPAAGTNVTIGTAYALNVAAGRTLLQATTFNAPLRLKNYTVATLPAGTQGDVAYVTDALAPAFLTAVAGGGAIVTPVFYDGTNWVAI